MTKTIVEVHDEKFEIWNKGSFSGEYMKLEVSGDLPSSGHVAVKNLFNGHMEYVRVSDVLILGGR